MFAQEVATGDTHGMAQGQFTKEEAKATAEAVTDILNGMSRAKKMEYLGHFNDILLFLKAAETAAPTEAEVEAKARPKAVG